MNINKQIIELDTQVLSKDPIVLCNRCFAKNIPLNQTLKIIALSCLAEKFNELGVKPSNVLRKFERTDIMYNHRWRLIQELNKRKTNRYMNTMLKKQSKENGNES